MKTLGYSSKFVAVDKLVRRGLLLQTLTVVHGVLESVVALAAGLAAGSVVLLGFGLDSLIEVVSASIIVWRLLVQGSLVRRQIADRVGLRLVGLSLIALAVYVAYDSTLALWRHEVPKESIFGVVLAAFSVVAMPMLARAKRHLARDLGSAALRADSVQSDLCAYLSGILLFGLGCNLAWGWWWADPCAALIMVPIILREGVLAMKGHACGCAVCAPVQS